MNTLEALAMGAAGALSAGIYYWDRWQKRKRVLQWFYTKQAHDWTAQSETVREQLFQKAFALRRAIELTTLSASEESSELLSRCLTLSEAFNLALEQVSDDLSEPFLEESLPLALQYFVKRWSEPNDEIELMLELPSDWPWRQAVKHRLLLWCLAECLTVWQSFLDPAFPRSLKLVLSRDKNIAKIQVAFSGQKLEGLHVPSRKNALRDELNNVQQIFEILMSGRCQMKCNDSQLVGEFRWPLVTKAFSS